MSLSDVSNEEMIKQYYLSAFVFSRPFRNIKYSIKRDSLIQATDALEVDMTTPNPEEDYLLKLYRIWLVTRLLCFYPDEPEYVYNYYKDHILDELEELLNRHKIAQIEEKREAEVQKPFWKIW